MPAAEAEAVKLFSNAYLAMRVAYFNELDAFCDARDMETSLVVQGVCADSRIGDFYNNPSFGFGGGCLPKDLRQLGNSFGGVPHALIRAIAESNETRMESVVDAVASRARALAGAACPVVGMYRLSMKSGVDDVRSSSMRRVAEGLQERGLRVIAYEPVACAVGPYGFEVVRDFRAFKDESDLIVANRWADELSDVSCKVYTRDLFGRD